MALTVSIKNNLKGTIYKYDSQYKEFQMVIKDGLIICGTDGRYINNLKGTIYHKLAGLET